MSTQICPERHPITRSRCTNQHGHTDSTHQAGDGSCWPNRGPSNPVVKHIAGGVIMRRQMRRMTRA